MSFTLQNPLRLFWLWIRDWRDWEGNEGSKHLSRSSNWMYVKHKGIKGYWNIKHLLKRKYGAEYIKYWFILVRMQLTGYSILFLAYAMSFFSYIIILHFKLMVLVPHGMLWGGGGAMFHYVWWRNTWNFTEREQNQPEATEGRIVQGQKSYTTLQQRLLSK